MARDRWLSGGVCSFPRDVLLIVPDPLDDTCQMRGLGLVLFFCWSCRCQMSPRLPFRRSCACRCRCSEGMMGLKGFSDDGLNEFVGRKTVGKACGLRRSRWGGSNIGAVAMLLLLLLLWNVDYSWCEWTNKRIVYYLIPCQLVETWLLIW